MFRILAYGATHVGRERKNNEDAFRISPESGLYLVCDGMGGHASGEIASQIAADAMVRFVSQDLHRPDFRWPIDTPPGLPEESRVLDASVRIANTEVFAAASANPLHKGMGTTVVGVLAGIHRLGLVHVGDSRIYRMRNGELTQLTEDHSLLNFYIQTRPMSADQIKQFAGKNVIVRAVGLRDIVEPDVQVQEYCEGDIYLLCTDGVMDMVDDAVIATTLADGGDQLTQTAERLIDHALNGGGKDNITVVLLQVVKVPDTTRSGLSSRATLPMDADELTAGHDELEDTSPGFDLHGADPSDAETLTEIEVRQSTVVRAHARTQEVAYRPWQQTELNAPPKPGMPLPYRRGIPLETQVSGDFLVDPQAPTDPHGVPLPPAARESHLRPALATTARHPVQRESQQTPVDDSAVTVETPRLSQPVPRDVEARAPVDTDEDVTADLPTVQSTLAKARKLGVPYQSGGTEVEVIAPVLPEDTDRVDGEARAAEVAEARRVAENPAAEDERRSALKTTAVGKPNPRRSEMAEQVAVVPALEPPPASQKSSPTIYVPSTPPPAPNPLTTIDGNAAPEGLPLDDDEEDI